MLAILQQVGLSWPARGFVRYWLSLASMLTWSLNYCCGSRILTPFGPVEALRGAWGDFEL